MSGLSQISRSTLIPLSIAAPLLLLAVGVTWNAAKARNDLTAQNQEQGVEIKAIRSELSETRDDLMSDVKALRRDISIWVDTTQRMNKRFALPPFPEDE